MKRFFPTLLLGVIILTTSEISAQTRNHTYTSYREHHSTVQVSFFPPLSTNGRQAPQFTNDVSLNVLVGVSRNERALTLAGIGNVIRRDANGFQGAGVFNCVGGDGRGVLVAGFGNFVGRDYSGAQFAGVINSVRDIDEGVQFAGAINIARDFDGGAQFAGAINIARDFDSGGVQFAGVINAARDMSGAQFAGAVNVARTVWRGAQFAGAMNVARDVMGLQVAGAINVARNVGGSQIAGAVNIARDVRGVQIGVVNIARRSETPIGLVNISREGEIGIGLGYNEIGTASVNFRSGGRVTYGILGVGYNYRTAHEDGVLSITGGLGAHINIARWLRINNELMAEHIIGDKVNTVRHDMFSRRNDDHDGWCDRESAYKASFAILPALRPVRWFEIFGGPSINYMQTGDQAMSSLLRENPLWERNRRGRTQQLFIGWQAGVQFIIKGRR